MGCSHGEPRVFRPPVAPNVALSTLTRESRAQHQLTTGHNSTELSPEPRLGLPNPTTGSGAPRLVAQCLDQQRSEGKLMLPVPENVASARTSSAVACNVNSP